MFLNGVEVINSELQHLHLNIQRNMQPKSDRPPVCPKGRLPLLHLTPSSNTQKKGEVSPANLIENPSLLKPTHDIPATPPPQTNPRPHEFFPQ